MSAFVIMGFFKVICLQCSGVSSNKFLSSPIVACKDVTNSSSDWQDFWEGRTPDDEFEGKLKEYGYEYAPTSSANIKLNATTPYNDGWT